LLWLHLQFWFFAAKVAARHLESFKFHRSPSNDTQRPAFLQLLLHIIGHIQFSKMELRSVYTYIYIYDYVYLHFMMLNARICISVSAVDLDLLVTGAAAPLGSYLPDWNKFVVDLGLRYLHTIARVSVRHLPMHDL